MVTGTQQEFQAQQQAAKAEGNTTSNPKFFEDLFGDSDFAGFDEESGEIQLNQIEQPQQSETSNEDESVADSPVSETQPTEDSGKNPSASEQRIANLESSFKTFQDTTTQILQQLVSKVTGQVPQQEQVEEEDFDYTDLSSLKKMIASQIEASLSKVLRPLQQTQQKTEMYMAASDAFNKYGADFTEKLPVIKELMTVDTSLSFEQAFLLSKKLEGLYVQKSPANSNGNSQTKTPQVTKPASELIQKAEKLQTVNGVTPAGQQRPVAKDIKAAFEQAWADLNAGSL